MDLQAPPIQRIVAHLLGLAQASIAPTHGGRHALIGSVEEAAVLDRFRPFAELFMLVAMADGQIDRNEHAVILGAFRSLTGGRVRGQSLEHLERELREKLAEEDPLDRLEIVCAALARDRREAELALTLASAVAVADSRVHPTEKTLLLTLAKWLRLPAESVSALLGAHGAKDGGGDSPG
jgi:tellurite resistance protein